MRFSVLTTALFAAGTLASPINKRDVVTDVVVDDVVVTDVVMTTVTEGQAPPSPVADPVVNVDTTTTTTAPAVIQQAQQPASSSPAPSSVVVQNKVAAPPVQSVAPGPVPSALPSVAPSAAPSSAQAPSSSAAPQPSSSPSGGLPTSFVKDLDTEGLVYQQLALLHHNIHRANHSASDLVWNSTLADYAKMTANTCVWDHNRKPGGGGYGQNIANGVAPGNISSIITNGLYNDEFEKYGGQWGNDNPDSSQFEGWGHLTQIVWKDTTSVGCYTSSCAPAGVNPQLCNPADGQPYLKGTVCGTNPGTPAFFTVCNYSPAGNVPGQYSNVQAPKGKGLVLMTEHGIIGM